MADLKDKAENLGSFKIAHEHGNFFLGNSKTGDKIEVSDKHLLLKQIIEKAKDVLGKDEDSQDYIMSAGETTKSTELSIRRYALGSKGEDFFIYDLTGKTIASLQMAHDGVDFVGEVELQQTGAEQRLKIYLSPINLPSHRLNKDDTNQLASLYQVLKKFKDNGFALNNIELGEEWKTLLFARLFSIALTSSEDIIKGSLGEWRFLSNEQSYDGKLLNQEGGVDRSIATTDDLFARLQAMYSFYEALQKREDFDFQALKSKLDHDTNLGLRVEQRIANDRDDAFAKIVPKEHRARLQVIFNEAVKNGVAQIEGNGQEQALFSQYVAELKQCEQLTFDEVIGIGLQNKPFFEQFKKGVEILLAEEAANRIMQTAIDSDAMRDELIQRELQDHVADTDEAQQAFWHQLQQCGLINGPATADEITSNEARHVDTSSQKGEAKNKNALTETFGSTTDEVAGCGVGYYPYLKAQESRDYKNIAVKIDIPELTAEEFSALIEELQKIIASNQPQPLSVEINTEVAASYQKVYANATVGEVGANKFALQINNNTAFEVSLEQEQGISIVFSNTRPHAQAIAAAAGVIHDIVDTYKQKNTDARIKGLVIKDYKADLVTGMSIFCSLACQSKPVRFAEFDKAFGADFATKKVAELLQNLTKTPQGKEQLLGLVDDEHKCLQSMIDLVRKEPNCSAEVLVRQIVMQKDRTSLNP